MPLFVGARPGFSVPPPSPLRNDAVDADAWVKRHRRINDGEHCPPGERVAVRVLGFSAVIEIRSRIGFALDWGPHPPCRSLKGRGIFSFRAVGICAALLWELTFLVSAVVNRRPSLQRHRLPR